MATPISPLGCVALRIPGAAWLIRPLSLLAVVFPASALATLTISPTSSNTSVGSSVSFTVSASSSSWNMSSSVGSWTSGPGPTTGTYKFTTVGTSISLVVSGSNGTATCAPINIVKGTQPTPSITASPTTIYTNQTSSVSASGGTGTGAYVYSIQSGPGTISGTTVTPTGAGTITVAVYRAADSNYNASSTATCTVTVNSLISASFTVSPTSFTYNGSSQGPTTVTPSPSGASYGTSGTTSATTAGSYTETVTANGNYTGTSNLGWTINQASQPTPSISASPSTINENATSAVSASGGAGTGGFVYSIQSGPGTISGTTVTPTGVGTITVAVYRAADTNHAQSPTATCNITVNAIPTTFSVSPTSFTYNAGSQGPTIAPSPSGATYGTSGTASATTAGNYSVTATANGNYTGTSGAVGWTINQASQPTPSISASPSTINENATSGVSASGGAGTGGFAYSIQSGPGTISGTTVTPTGVGTITVAVYRAADTNYAQSPTATCNITVNAIPTTFSVSPTSFTYNAGSQGPTIAPSPSGATYGTSGTASATTAGNYSVTATANGNYTGTSGAVGWTINQASQPTPSVTASPNQIYTNGTSTVTASGGAGTGGYVYSLQSGSPGTISGTTVTPTGAGTITVLAYRASDTNYLQSPTGSCTITVYNLNTTIFTVSPTSFTYNGSAQGPTITPNPSAATYSTSGSTSATTAGNYSVTATANGNYTGTSGAIGWSIAKATPSVSWSSPAAITCGTALSGTQLDASGSVGGSITYVDTSNNNSAVSVGTVLNAGTHVLQAALAPSDSTDYNSASATVNLVVNAVQTTFTVSPVTFTYSGSAQGPTITPNPANASFGTSGTTSATSPGSYTVTATANGNYSGTSGQVSWTVNKANQAAISASASPNPINVGGTSAISASGGSGTGGFSYSISGPGTLSGTTVTGTGVGTVVVTVTKAADTNYLQATTTVSIPVNQGSGIPVGVMQTLGVNPNNTQTDTSNQMQVEVLHPN
jgi:hypothetical protein